jgi:hypothetical protein
MPFRPQPIGVRAQSYGFRFGRQRNFLEAAKPVAAPQLTTIVAPGAVAVNNPNATPKRFANKSLRQNV